MHSAFECWVTRWHSIRYYPVFNLWKGELNHCFPDNDYVCWVYASCSFYYQLHTAGKVNKENGENKGKRKGE